jgi:winged helix DNA-binding protein
LDIPAQRLHTQHLLGSRLQRPEDVVRWLTAVQSQDYPGAKWGVAQRTVGSTATDIDRAFNDGAILRTHVMRPTWHFVMPEDIRWMLELTAPRIKALMATYDRRLELDEALYARTNAAIEKALQVGKHLTRTELAQALKDAGIEATGQRLAHIVSRAELDAVICSGAPRGKQHTYALLAERAPHARRRDREEALGELSVRYFSSHGPALVQDFAWWSGLTVADAKAGLELVKGQLIQETIDGKTYWFARSAQANPRTRPTVHLLPNYDEYLIAYRDRSAFVDPARLGDAPFFQDVLRRHIIVVNGQVVGGWHSSERPREATIHLRPLIQLTQAQQAALGAAAKSYSRFLGRSVTLANS